ncbi:MAG: DUF5615 family PIN-like protein [Acidimicrobiales bacterium]
MKFLIDSMLPPRVVDLLAARGHEAITPAGLGAHNLPDDVLVRLAAVEGRVIVTENASDFSGLGTCPVLLVRKSWWPSDTVASSLAGAVHRWAEANPAPGAWPHWMTAAMR